MATTQVFFCECCEFFKSSFFYRTPPVAAFISNRKGRREKRGKGGGTIFQMKEKNENVSFNFCVQVSVLVKTEM